jgi:2-phospho-L-lactate guanylyltransferase
MSSSHRVDWRLVVPVKGGAAAKSRLHPPPGVWRSALAAAMARDCLAAACSGMPPGRVHVVTSDPAAAAWAAGLGAAVVPDPGGGLNAAVAAGVRAALRTAAGPSLHPADDAVGTVPADDAVGTVPADTGVAVLLGDLPALRPDDLAAALLAAAAYDRVVVPDAAGTGTVLLTARGAAGLDPAFGDGSAARHAAAGHRRLELDLPRLRTDVDDDQSLAAAAALGLGPATVACLDAAGGSLPVMQASVHTFDEGSGAGTALLDDGREVAFPAEVFAASALRRLRPGQRVSIDLGPDGTAVQRLWIVGIGDDQRIG